MLQGESPLQLLALAKLWQETTFSRLIHSETLFTLDLRVYFTGLQYYGKIRLSSIYF